MYIICRACRGPLTSSDGVAASCPRCEADTSRPAGVVPSAQRVAKAPDIRVRPPMALTLAERTVVHQAMRLPGRMSDIALAGTLPLLTLEVAVRATARRVSEGRGGSHLAPLADDPLVTIVAKPLSGTARSGPAAKPLGS